MPKRKRAPAGVKQVFLAQCGSHVIGVFFSPTGAQEACRKVEALPTAAFGAVGPDGEVDFTKLVINEIKFPDGTSEQWVDPDTKRRRAKAGGKKKAAAPLAPARKITWVKP